MGPRGEVGTADELCSSDLNGHVPGKGCCGETRGDAKLSCVDGGERLPLDSGVEEGSGRLQQSLEVIEGCPMASVMRKVRLDNHCGPFRLQHL